MYSKLERRNDEAKMLFDRRKGQEREATTSQFAYIYIYIVTPRKNGKLTNNLQSPLRFNPN